MVEDGFGRREGYGLVGVGVLSSLLGLCFTGMVIVLGLGELAYG